MLYFALLSRIHWQAVMMSDVFAWPFWSITLIDTRGAVGAAPVRCGAAPAAMSATKVPCPRRPALDLLPAIVDRLTLARRRLPKSARFWPPESTIALVGVDLL